MKNSHMTLDDRLEIEAGLKKQETLTNIARSLSKDLSTIRKEIIKHRNKIYPSTFNSPRNLCVHFYNKTCEKVNICGLEGCKTKCYSCKRHFCNKICDNYKEYLCEHLLHKPYCCNGCENRKQCRLIKMIYIAKDADKDYHKTLKNSRTGPRISENGLNYINDNVAPRVKNGQSFESIVLSDKNIEVSVSTLYDYTNKDYIENLNILDLPKKASYKQRNKKEKDTNDNEKNKNIINKLKETRNYNCFLKFTKDNPSFNISEMDTVYGNKNGEGKVLLTLLFRKSNFMIAILLKNRKAETVNNALTILKNKLKTDIFTLLFRVLLTDNGVEFNMIEDIENIENQQKINLFFCDAGESTQKAKIEKNHVEVRKILPKGTSFDNLKQRDINLVMSHVNCYKRKKLNGLSPYEVIAKQYGIDFANHLMDLLGYQIINPKDVVLKPKLLKEKK